MLHHKKKDKGKNGVFQGYCRDVVVLFHFWDLNIPSVFWLHKDIVFCHFLPLLQTPWPTFGEMEIRLREKLFVIYGDVLTDCFRLGTLPEH